MSKRYVLDEKALEIAMAKKGVKSYTELVKKAGGTVQTVMSLRNGAAFPLSKTYDGIINFLGLTPNDLIEKQE